LVVVDDQDLFHGSETGGLRAGLRGCVPCGGVG
jgi:hypothetical protein